MKKEYNYEFNTVHRTGSSGVDNTPGTLHFDL